MNPALLLADAYEFEYEEDSQKVSTPSCRERSSRAQWSTRRRYQKRTGKRASLSSGSHQRR